MSTETSRTVNHGMRMLNDTRTKLNGHQVERIVRKYSQDGHRERIPEILLTNDVCAIGVPVMRIGVVDIACGA